MLRPIPTLVALAAVLSFPDIAFAQSAPAAQAPVTVRASAAGGRVHGVVRDDLGQAVSGVSVIAMGTTVAAASSDLAGRFVLALPPGEYILRAAHDGYVSTFREPVSLRASQRIERDITLVRLGARLAGSDAAVEQALAFLEPVDHAHTDLAWRLRHLRRSVLRDTAPAGAELLGQPDQPAGDEGFFDRAFYESARVAASFFRDTNFDGRFNWLTTGSLDFSGSGFEASRSGSVAFLDVGAPVGSHGAWSMRGAFSPGEPSSWVVLGEYAAQADERHAFLVGVSHAAVRPGHSDPTVGALAPGDARTAGAAYVFDRWRVLPGLEVSYGLRVDSFDFLAVPAFFSPQLGAGVRVAQSTWVRFGGRQQVVAPGAAEFQAPESGGLWMPPHRTFFTSRYGGPLDAERVRHVEVAVEHTFGGPGGQRTVSLARFEQRSEGQIATLFGLGRLGAGRYLTTAVGDARVDGWTLRFTGELLAQVRGTIDYTTGRVAWEPGRLSPGLAARVPSIARDEAERLHDVSASLEADIPATSARILVAYRVSSGFSRLTDAEGPRARFDIEVRQPLPYQPIRGGIVDVLVGIRSLHRELGAAGSLYDELLTVSPPTRFVGGLQVRF